MGQVMLDSIDPSPEELEFIYQVFHAMNSEAFKEKPLYYKTVPIDRAEYEVKTLPPADLLQRSIDSFQSNATSYIEKGNFSNNLILESRFPLEFQMDDIQESVDFEFCCWRYHD